MAGDVGSGADAGEAPSAGGADAGGATGASGAAGAGTPGSGGAAGTPGSGGAGGEAGAPDIGGAAGEAGSPDTGGSAGVAGAAGSGGAGCPVDCSNGSCVTGDGGAFCDCDPGYQGSTCENGVLCNALAAPEDGSVSYDPDDRRYPNTATYECDLGFALDGSETRECDTEGGWGGSAPSCEPVMCPSNLSVDNGDVDLSDGTDVGDTAIYECDQGYEIDGDDTRSCLITGQWSGDAPECLGVPCEDPPSLEGIDGTWHYNLRDCRYDAANTCIITLECDSGTPTGGEKYCDDTGGWTPPTPPSCN